MSSRESLKRLDAYRQWLVLKAVNEDFDATKLSPPPKVDAIWHEHILDTKHYAAACTTSFGRVMHHDPNGDADSLARIARRVTTLFQLRKVFGDNYDKETWAYSGARPSTKRERAVVKQEDTPASRTRRRSTPSDESLNIRIRDGSTGEETFYKVKSTTKLSRVIDAYATRKGVCAASLRFLFDGSRIRSDLTPGDIDMRDGDQLYCMPEQSGC